MQRPRQLPRQGSWRATPRRWQLEKEQSRINRQTARAGIRRQAARKEGCVEEVGQCPLLAGKGARKREEYLRAIAIGTRLPFDGAAQY